MFGHNGKILKVNLCTGEIEEESYDSGFGKMFLDGNGIAAKLIYDSVPSSADPFAPENMVVSQLAHSQLPLYGEQAADIWPPSTVTGLIRACFFGNGIDKMLLIRGS